MATSTAIGARRSDIGISEKGRAVISMKTFTFVLLLAITAPDISMAGHSDNQPLTRQSDVANGQRLYTNCSGCHGADAGGKPDGSIPAIAGQHWQVLIKSLLDFRYFRRWDSRMALKTSDHLRGPQEIDDVVAYVSGLQPPREVGVGTGEHVARGARTYEKRCSHCHGAQGQGNGPDAYPRLANQQYAYLKRQMGDGARGIRPTYSERHVRLLRDLDVAEIDGIADYLSRLETSTPSSH